MRAIWKRPTDDEIRVVGYQGKYSILGLDHSTVHMLGLALSYLKDENDKNRFIDKLSRMKVDDLHRKILRTLS